MNKYVIIGGGIAALGAIEGIRSIDKEGTITVICDESVPPYARPLISYYLENKTNFEKMQYRTEDYYRKLKVNFLLDTSAKKIEEGSVALQNGEKIPFDKLLAATGSSPFVPTIEGYETVSKKFTFMTENDAKALEDSTDKDSDILIIGAGLIGLKCAEGLKNRVKSITVCDLADRVLSSILDNESASIIEESLKKENINLMLSDSAIKFENNTAVMKSGKKVNFDVLVMAVGVRPNISILKDIDVKINRGVIVNPKMETSVPNIYAAGDIAESYDITAKTSKIMAILPNAYIGGFTAGTNMAGGDKRFDNQIPMNSIGFFGLHLMSAGSYDGDVYEEKTENGLKKLFIKDNRLVGFIIIGNVDKTGIYTYLVRNSVPLDSIDFDSIKKNPSLLPFSYEYRRKNLGGVL